MVMLSSIAHFVAFLNWAGTSGVSGADLKRAVREAAHDGGINYAGSAPTDLPHQSQQAATTLVEYPRRLYERDASS